MKLPISNRLLACAAFVRPGDRVADVGCDHGYLGIHLILNGIASEVYASDVVEGPLKSAMGNAVKFGVTDKLRFFLSDGVRAVPRDFDVLICAGMGADSIISILEAAPWLRDPHYRLILQCQSKRPALRRYLSDQGWHICRETLAQDGRFLYPVAEVLFEEAPALTEAQCWISPALLKCGNPLLAAFLERTEGRLKQTVQGLTGAEDPRASDYIALLAELRQMRTEAGL